MKVSSIQDLAHQHMLSILGVGNGAKSSLSSGTSLSDTSKSTAGMSPFAKMLSELQQVEQNNPNQYSKLTKAISSHLSSAANSAKGSGNTALAATLNTLSADFANASQTGQMPNVGDLTSAFHIASNGNSNSSASTNANLTSQLAANHLNPLQIIGNVLGIPIG